MPAGSFPGPYINTTKEDDPIMKRRPPDHLEIGARPQTLRSVTAKGGLMSIGHVPDQNSK